jgi:hypothetical protein
MAVLGQCVGSRVPAACRVWSILFLFGESRRTPSRRPFLLDGTEPGSRLDGCIVSRQSFVELATQVQIVRLPP